MLWRRTYETQVLGARQVPDLPMHGRHALLGSRGADGFRELEVWRRLCEAELPIPYALASEDLEGLLAITPSSRHSQVFRLAKTWESTFQEAKCLALIGQGTRAEVIMLGSPTEEAWENFVALASS